jgi:hypothetical protein
MQEIIVLCPHLWKKSCNTYRIVDKEVMILTVREERIKSSPTRTYFKRSKTTYCEREGLKSSGIGEKIW